MVISKKEFEEKKVDPNIQRIGKNQMRILKLLREDTKKAWSQTEVQRKLGIKHMAAANYALHTLQKKGLVTSKIVKGIIYWRALDDDVPEVLPKDSSNSKGESGNQEK